MTDSLRSDDVHSTGAVNAMRCKDDAANDEKSIRAIVKCLSLLSALNQFNGSSAQNLAKKTGLPRSTVYRMLETLSGAGYLRQDKHTREYWLEAKCLDLSIGYSDQSWIHESAEKVIDELRHTNNLGVVLTTPDLEAGSIVVRVATTLRNPENGLRTIAGRRIPIGQSCSGHCYLAHCAPELRETLLDMIFAGQGSGGTPFIHNHVPLKRPAAEKLLNVYAKQGYALGHATHEKSGRVGVLAVPVVRHGQVAGSLSLNFYYSSAKPAILKDYLQRLKDAASVIGRWEP